MNKLKAFSISLALAACISIVPAAVYAAGEGDVRDGLNATGTQGGLDLRSAIEVVTNILLFVIGAVAVIMIIVGGLKYVTSNGDSSQITSAKNTILYAVVGIIVALLAYAIVNFVLSQFVK